MKKIKYFDCSINEISNLNHNIQSYGTFENDIMRDLGKYANNFGFERIYDYKCASIIITNTLFPKDVLIFAKNNNIPLIKRMDGIYWQKNLLYKNKYHNEAALSSNYVIFISEYSKNTHKTLYNLDINGEVILNNVDDTIFYPNSNKKQKHTLKLVTSCTNWNRDGKRFNELIEFSKNIEENIYLIGKCDSIVPKNIIKCGYIEDQNTMANIIRNCDIFLSFFFRDAGSKVTCQAIQCKLPILYSKTGGLPEIIKDYGVSIPDYSNIDFLNETPPLNINNILESYDLLKTNYFNIRQKYTQRESYQSTLGNYFKVMRRFI